MILVFNTAAAGMFSFHSSLEKVPCYCHLVWCVFPLLPADWWLLHGRLQLWHLGQWWWQTGGIILHPRIAVCPILWALMMAGRVRRCPQIQFQQQNVKKALIWLYTRTYSVLSCRRKTLPYLSQLLFCHNNKAFKSELSRQKKIQVKELVYVAEE